MKVLLQRVNYAKVTVNSEVCGEISRGLLLLVGFGAEDTAEKLSKMADKFLNLRIFPNEQGRFDLSCLDIGGEILLVPQFTLYAITEKRGRRPDFTTALAPDKARELFDLLIEQVRLLSKSKVACGIFGAYMRVALENDGPVTILLEE